MTQTPENDAPHLVRIKHDAESHEHDCHDDCEAEVVCPGVTASCRVWWECGECLNRTDDQDEALWENAEAHGVEHQHIDGMWMTAGGSCIGVTLETDANDLVYSQPEGDHPVDLECDDGFVYVSVIPPEETQP